jgi:hypothetical protein
MPVTNDIDMPRATGNLHNVPNDVLTACGHRGLHTVTSSTASFLRSRVATA